MLNKRSNKEKFILLSAGIIVLIWVAYQFTFLRTIELWKECSKLEKQQNLIKAIPDQLPVLTGKIALLEKALGSAEGEDLSTLILKQVNLLCQKYNVILKEIPEKHIFNGKDLIVETLNINLEGRFTDLLLIISELSKNQNGARLRSVKLQAVVDQLTGERSLQGTLFLQSVKLIVNN